jgi:hypothetical protein
MGLVMFILGIVPFMNGGVPVPEGLGGLGAVLFLGGVGLVMLGLMVPLPTPPPRRVLLLIKNCQLTATCMLDSTVECTTKELT